MNVGEKFRKGNKSTLPDSSFSYIFSPFIPSLVHCIWSIIPPPPHDAADVVAILFPDFRVDPQYVQLLHFTFQCTFNKKSFIAFIFNINLPFLQFMLHSQKCMPGVVSPFHHRNLFRIYLYMNTIHVKVFSLLFPVLKLYFMANALFSRHSNRMIASAYFVCKVHSESDFSWSFPAFSPFSWLDYMYAYFFRISYGQVIYYAE